MGPTSVGTLVALVLVALALPVLALRLGARWRERGVRGRLRTPAVVGLILLSQLSAVAAAGVAVNRAYGFAPTWASVWSLVNDDDDDAEPLTVHDDGTGASQPSGAAPATPTPSTSAPSAPRPLVARGRESTCAEVPTTKVPQPQRGNGTYRTYAVTGAVSGARENVIVWLPPGHESGTGLAGLPVVVMVGGAYGTVDNTVRMMRFGNSIGPLVSSGRIPAFVAVFPEVNLDLPRDSQCVDQPGVSAFSWLAYDVPGWAARQGLNRDGRRWSVQGWSVGGYCAARLRATVPESFAAAAPVQGNFTPRTDGTTGSLRAHLKAHPEVARQADVAAVLGSSDGPRPARMAVIYSAADPQSVTDAQRFLAATKGIPGIVPMSTQDGGHVIQFWRQVQPQTLEWLLAQTR